MLLTPEIYFSTFGEVSGQKFWFFQNCPFFCCKILVKTYNFCNLITLIDLSVKIWDFNRWLKIGSSMSAQFDILHFWIPLGRKIHQKTKKKTKLGKIRWWVIRTYQLWKFTQTSFFIRFQNRLRSELSKDRPSQEKYKKNIFFTFMFGWLCKWAHRARKPKFWPNHAFGQILIPNPPLGCY